MIKMIWAMDESHLIGDGDKIPWHIKEDLLYYKSKTKGQTVLMGDVTYYSLKGYYKDKPLPYGKIYVATLDKTLNLPDAEVIYDINSFLSSNNCDLWVVGGATIYKICLILPVERKKHGSIKINEACRKCKFVHNTV